MPKQANPTGGKGSKKAGRSKAKCQRYHDHKMRERNKLKRILRSNGYAYALAWAKANVCTNLLPSV
jgi:hypothetical protein